MKILLDTNIVLDLLLAREPFVKEAKEIFGLIEQNRIVGYLSATSVTTLHYLLNKELNKIKANSIIKALLKLFNIAEVDREILLLSCDDGGLDYEDSVIFNAALKKQVDFILTRDKKGFGHSSIKVLSPKEFIAFWKTIK
jgi:predicted nucleic acid-binding protein